MRRGRLIEANWEGLDREGRGDSESAIELVRLHVAASLGSSSAEAVREFLDRAQRLCPNDDRVWLGRANLAIRQGELDEAARWLDACLRRSPEDVPVWRARLDWAVATGRVAEAREALEHMPAAESPPAQVHRLAAWFAARRGGCRIGAAGVGAADRGRSGRRRGPRPAGRAGGRAGSAGPRRRAPAARRPRSIRSRLDTRSCSCATSRVRDARGDGPPGGATGPLVRGQGVLEPGGCR